MNPDIVSALIGMAAAVLTSAIGYFVQRAALSRRFDMDEAEIRTRFMAEQVAKALLSQETYKKRSLAAIRRRLGGFEDNALRRILVRAGAVRFVAKDGTEYWGLIEKNVDALTTRKEREAMEKAVSATDSDEEG